MTDDQLTDAKAKYHLLVTGGAARVVVDQNGERVEFIGARSADLLAYIRTAEPNYLITAAAVCRPFRFIF